MKHNYGKQRKTSGTIRGINNKTFKPTMGYSYEKLVIRGQDAATKDIPMNFLSFYDSKKKQCKLCYESVEPRRIKTNKNGNEGKFFLINTLDGKPHRKKLGKRFYCSMAKNNEVQKTTD